MSDLLQAAVDIVHRAESLGFWLPDEVDRLAKVDRARYDRYVVKQNRKGLPVAPYRVIARPVDRMRDALAGMDGLPAPSADILWDKPWAQEGAEAIED